MTNKSKENTLVMKFGGSSVASPEHFSKISDIIVAGKKAYPRIVVVVSAMGDMTDRLIALAHKIHRDPPRREYDMLVSVGERISISLLAMALAAKNQEAVSFTGSQSGIITSAEHTDARIIDVKPHRLLPPLNDGKIVIVAGFQGVSTRREITTLGRGGSDTSAVALGIALRAKSVEFYKDVGGVFSHDPKTFPQAKHIPQMSYSQALDILDEEHAVLHPRAVLLAQQNGLPLRVLSFVDRHDVPSTATTITVTTVKRKKQCSYEYPCDMQ